MPDLSIWLLLHFLLAAAVTWAARAYALRRRLLDHPGERRSHTVATPRGGGIAIVVSVLLAASWLAMLAAGKERMLLASFAVGLVLVAGIGWWDDHKPLSPGIRLAVQAVAALILAWGIYQTGTGPWSALSALLLALVLVNVWNFMDGIDGIATSQAALAATGYFLVLSGPWGALAAGLLAACLGFLPFNYPRARIFLGDVGSGALGYTLAALLAVSLRGSSVEWPLLLLPVSVFLIDAGFTLMARMLARERWWTPHVTHVYQQAAFRFGHVKVTAAYFLLGVVTLMLMLLSSSASMQSALVILFGSGLFLLALWLGIRKGLKS